MKRSVAFTSIVAGMLLAGAAQAQSYGESGVRYDYAEVINVQPIIDVVERPVQRDQCWREPVQYREPVRHHDDSRSRAPAILGAIVGGVIGNQFGSGHGRDAATAAGALLGYNAVRDEQRRNGGYYSGGREYTRYEQRCSVQTEYFRDEQVTGYDVTYRYGDQVLHTVTDYHPGNRLRVRVDVTPEP